MLTTSPETAALDAAMAAAQGEIESAAKDKVNPAFRSKYADLSAVWDAIRPALSRHKIAVTQWPVHSEDGRLHIVTRLAHAGEWMQAHFSIPVGKADAHGHGSAITYAKRYTLAAAVGVVADEDDDGNAASKAKPMPKKDQRPLFTALQTELRALTSKQAIVDWSGQNADRINSLDESWRNELSQEAAGMIRRFKITPHSYDDLVAGFETRLKAAATSDARAAIWDEVEDHAETGALFPPDVGRLRLLVPELA